MTAACRTKHGSTRGWMCLGQADDAQSFLAQDGDPLPNSVHPPALIMIQMVGALTKYTDRKAWSFRRHHASLRGGPIVLVGSPERSIAGGGPLRTGWTIAVLADTITNLNDPESITPCAPHSFTISAVVILSLGLLHPPPRKSSSHGPYVTNIRSHSLNYTPDFHLLLYSPFLDRLSSRSS